MPASRTEPPFACGLHPDRALQHEAQQWRVGRHAICRCTRSQPGVTTPRPGGEVEWEPCWTLEVLAAMGPERFTVQVPAGVLDDLRSRLACTRWPDPLPCPGWAAGAGIGYLKELVAYWKGLVRLGRAGAAAVLLRPVHRRHRRPAGALCAPARPRPRPVPAGAHPRLAELVRRAAHAGAAAERPGRPRRRAGTASTW